jgi:GT2 family glycosyltransferase
MRVLSVACIEPPVQGHRPSKYFLAANLGIDPCQFNIQQLDNFLTENSQKDDVLPIGVNYPFFVERTVFEKIGGADERFAGPYHDPDLFLRFRNNSIEMVRTRETALYHFSGVSLRFSEKAKQIRKRKKSIRWIEQENQARLSFIKKWGAKPKAKFGEIPKTEAAVEFDWKSQSNAKKLQVYSLLAWEMIRAKLRTFRHSW